MKETTYKCDGCEEPLTKGEYFNMVEGSCVFLLKSINDSLHEHYSVTLKLKSVSEKNIEREYCYNCLIKMIKNAHIERLNANRENNNN